MIKDYIIDTNVMIHDPYFFNNFEENNIIMPIICIEELDTLKNREGMVGFHARSVFREINKLRKNGDFSTGIKLETGGTIRIELNHMDTKCLPNGLDQDKNDNKILSICEALSKLSDNTTILVTKDLSMKIKADSLGINVQDYKFDKVSTDTLYKGYSELELSSKEIDMIFDFGLPLPSRIEEEIYPNHFFHVKNIENSSHELLAKYNGSLIVPLKYQNESAWGLKPINMEQKMAFELLMDESVHFVTLTGGAGSGKTILPTSVALQKVIEKGVYRKIVFVRPVVPAGNDIGYLPGNEIEKLKPWMGPFYDAIDNLFDNKSKDKKTIGNTRNENSIDMFIDMFREKGIIETKSFTYMRGRTLSGSLVIVDEAQQTTPHLAKLLLTRAGHDSKFVFVGDPSDNQIDNILVDSKSNGLVYTVDKMKYFDITGHIQLRQVERSPLAKIAEKHM
ncbi:PhoH family protein [Alkaliphilus pronyensis]|uniref:PhoH family protein n=1 Tax=Alkaliphilus pronyensis TaxID=1482732 RepID=A0A6I0FJR6_9FIRM|nr:PhoH family protein [Alkaliphilus pronyensis]KAB3539009.1 PhoH family protein [Alkaliphilus pronyensis]